MGVGRKHLYLRANAEARAITEQPQFGKQREDELTVRIGEVLDAKLAEGFQG